MAMHTDDTQETQGSSYNQTSQSTTRETVSDSHQKHDILHSRGSSTSTSSAEELQVTTSSYEPQQCLSALQQKLNRLQESGSNVELINQIQDNITALQEVFQSHHASRSQSAPLVDCLNGNSSQLVTDLKITQSTHSSTVCTDRCRSETHDLGLKSVERDLDNRPCVSVSPSHQRVPLSIPFTHVSQENVIKSEINATQNITLCSRYDSSSGHVLLTPQPVKLLDSSPLHHSRSSLTSSVLKQLSFTPLMSPNVQRPSTAHQIQCGPQQLKDIPGCAQIDQNWQRSSMNLSTVSSTPLLSEFSSSMSVKKPHSNSSRLSTSFVSNSPSPSVFSRHQSGFASKSTRVCGGDVGSLSLRGNILKNQVSQLETQCAWTRTCDLTSEDFLEALLDEEVCRSTSGLEVACSGLGMDRNGSCAADPVALTLMTGDDMVSLM